MDFFGIGVAMQALVRVYRQASRATGRTTSMLDTLKPGDRVVFADSREANRVRQLLLQKGVAATCIVVDPRDPCGVIRAGRSEGRTIPDHSWVEAYFAHVIDCACGELDDLTKQASGRGATPYVTRRFDIEVSKWG